MTLPAIVHSSLPWPGFNERGSLILPLPWFLQAFALPPAWRIGETTLQRKDEFHLTLLSRREAALIRGQLADEIVARTFDCDVWSLGAIGACWYIESPDRLKRSIIAEVAIASLNPFRAALSAAAGVALADVLAHVTLFVSGSPNGIGLESIVGFEALDRRRISVFDVGD